MADKQYSERFGVPTDMAPQQVAVGGLGRATGRGG
jgi:hypothetical protein